MKSIDNDHVACVRRIHREAANLINDLQMVNGRLEVLAYLVRNFSPQQVEDSLGGNALVAAVQSTLTALQVEQSQTRDIAGALYPVLQKLIDGESDEGPTTTPRDLN